MLLQLLPMLAALLGQPAVLAAQTLLAVVVQALQDILALPLEHTILGVISGELKYAKKIHMRYSFFYGSAMRKASSPLWLILTFASSLRKFKIIGCCTHFRG